MYQPARNPYRISNATELYGCRVLKRTRVGLVAPPKLVKSLYGLIKDILGK